MIFTELEYDGVFTTPSEVRRYLRDGHRHATCGMWMRIGHTISERSIHHDPDSSGHTVSPGDHRVIPLPRHLFLTWQERSEELRIYLLKHGELTHDF